MDIEEKIKIILLQASSNLLDVASEDTIPLHVDIQVSDSGAILLCRYGEPSISWIRLNTEGTVEADKDTVEFLKRSVDGIIT